MPPVVTIVSPTPGVAPGAPGGFSVDWQTARMTPIVVDITGSTYQCAVLQYPGAVNEATIYRDGAFRGEFAALSWSEIFGGALRLHVLPATGWASSDVLNDVQITIDALDATGVTNPPPSFVAAGVVAVGTSALGVTPIPVQHQTGDILVMLFQATEAGPYVLTDPQGFAEMPSSPQVTTGDVAGSGTRGSLYWARCTSNAMLAPTIADIAGDGHKMAVIIAIRGCVSVGNPWNVTAGDATDAAAASTAIAIPGLVTTVPNTLILDFIAHGIDIGTAQVSGWANGDLTNVIECSGTNLSTVTGGGGGFAAAIGTRAIAGPVGPTTATLLAASTQARIKIAMRSN